MNIKTEKKDLELLDVKTAVEKVQENSKSKQRKFVETIDLIMNLNIDPKQSNQNIRGSVLLPSGSGKKVRVIVFTDNETKQQEAIQAGAVEAGMAELMTKIENGFLDFDYCVATPNVMKNLGKVAKKLGPRGLMPNPKNGNITDDVTTAVSQAMKGKINFKNDKTGIVHLIVGKVDFSIEDLLLNVKAVIGAVKENKPEGLKGKYIKSVFLTSTMGSSVAVDIEKI